MNFEITTTEQANAPATEIGLENIISLQAPALAECLILTLIL